MDEESDEPFATQKKVLDKFCIFDHSSGENIYRVKQWFKKEAQNQLSHMNEAKDHLSEFSNEIPPGTSLS